MWNWFSKTISRTLVPDALAAAVPALLDEVESLNGLGPRVTGDFFCWRKFSIKSRKPSMTNFE